MEVECQGPGDRCRKHKTSLFLSLDITMDAQGRRIVVCDNGTGVCIELLYPIIHPEKNRKLGQITEKKSPLFRSFLN